MTKKLTICCNEAIFIKQKSIKLLLNAFIYQGVTAKSRTDPCFFFRVSPWLTNHPASTLLKMLPAVLLHYQSGASASYLLFVFREVYVYG